MTATTMIRAAALAALCTLGATTAVAEDAGFDPQARMTEALGRVRPIAYHRATLDWEAIEKRVRALAEGARDEVDLMPAYQAVVSYLEDNHSSVRYPEGLMDRWRERYGNRRMLPDPPPSRPRADSSFAGRTEPEVRLADLPGAQSVATIVVPAVAYADSIPSPYGTRLHRAVREVHAEVCGYIVDLRGNTGGDMFPMVIGLADLIGEGHRVVFQKPDEPGSSAVLTAGTVQAEMEDGSSMPLDRVADWRPPPPEIEARPVAVLIDGATASSGEGVALALIGREGVRTFGAASAGLASANEPLTLSDGTRLFITTSMMTDRLGRTYPQGISPDEPVTTEGEAGDAVDAAAKAWLATQASCAGSSSPQTARPGPDASTP